MKKYLEISIILIMIFVLTGCAPGINDMANVPDNEDQIAGFWSGLWHGFIILFTFIISVFSDGVTMYEVHNNGFWYNLGFIFGVMTFFGGGGGGACRRSRNK